MTRKEIASSNIEMTSDFIRHLLDNPGAVDFIPDGAELDFIGADALPEPLARPKTKMVRYRVGHVFEQVK